MEQTDGITMNSNDEFSNPLSYDFIKEDTFYIIRNKKKNGPYNLSQLVEMKENDFISSHELILCTKSNAIMPVSVLLSDDTMKNSQVNDSTTNTFDPSLFIREMYITKNEKQTGPFTLEQITQLLNNNSISYDDFIIYKNALHPVRLKDLFDSLALAVNKTTVIPLLSEKSSHAKLQNQNKKHNVGKKLFKRFYVSIATVLFIVLCVVTLLLNNAHLLLDKNTIFINEPNQKNSLSKLTEILFNDISQKQKHLLPLNNNSVLNRFLYDHIRVHTYFPSMSDNLRINKTYFEHFHPIFIGHKVYAVIANPAMQIDEINFDDLKKLLQGRISEITSDIHFSKRIKLLITDECQSVANHTSDYIEIVSSSGYLEEQVLTNSSAIGILPLYLVSKAKPVHIRYRNKIVPPTTFNIHSNEYPLISKIICFVPKKDNSLELIKSQLSRQSESLRQFGITIHKVFSEYMLLDYTTSQEYNTLIEGLQKLSVKLILKESGEIDYYSASIIPEIVKFIEENHGLNKKVTIIGLYSDTSGSYNNNSDINNRLQNIVRIFENYGIKNIEYRAIFSDKSAYNNNEKNLEIEMWI